MESFDPNHEFSKEVGQQKSANTVDDFHDSEKKSNSTYIEIISETIL